MFDIISRIVKVSEVSKVSRVGTSTTLPIRLCVWEIWLFEEEKMVYSTLRLCWSGRVLHWINKANKLTDYCHWIRYRSDVEVGYCKINHKDMFRLSQITSGDKDQHCNNISKRSNYGLKYKYNKWNYRNFWIYSDEFMSTIMEPGLFKIFRCCYVCHSNILTNGCILHRWHFLFKKYSTTFKNSSKLVLINERRSL